ncbi:hypothetical protein [Enhygromyxa salina]|nr:hypothetical protein [Enhygromyxa salina]
MGADPLSNWKETAAAVDLQTLGEQDPFAKLEAFLKPKLLEILCARASELPQDVLVQGCMDERFGRYGWHFSEYIEAPMKWGYRDNDSDVKPLTAAFGKKGEDHRALGARVLQAARARYDASTTDGLRWSPLFRTNKTRHKLLGFAVDGKVDVAPEQRCVFSPFARSLNELLEAAGPLPLIAPLSKEKVEYVKLDRENSKSAAPSYVERWMVAWAASSAASFQDAAGCDPITPVAEHVLEKSEPWTVWGYVARRHVYLAVNKKGWIKLVNPFARTEFQYLPDGLEAQLVPSADDSKAPPTAVSIHEWAAKTPEELRAALFADLPSEARSKWKLAPSVLAHLYANRGCIDKSGHIRFAAADIVTSSATYGLSYAWDMYRDVRDARPGTYHQLAYSEELQASLCIHAEDTSGDPVVYDIDHENWLRGEFGTLSSFCARALHPRKP